jgi:acetyl-CoA synthetase
MSIPAPSTALLPASRDFAAIRRDFRWTVPDDANIGTAICDRWANHDPDRTALIWKRPDGVAEKISYGRLQAKSNRFANVLKAHGIRRGDRVALILAQGPAAAIAHIAIYKIGAIAVPLAMLFGVDALAYRLRDSGAVAVISNLTGLAKLDGIRDTLPDLRVVFSSEGAFPGAEDFYAETAKASPSLELAATGPDTPAMMIYTSGTTGPPKGALHGHRVLWGHLPSMALWHGFLPQPGDLFWTPSDWAWAGGLLNALFPALWFGVPVVARKFEKFDPEEALALMAELGIRNTFVPPTALRMLRAVPDIGARYRLSLRTIGSAGEALGAETYEWGRSAFGIPIDEFYGQTECNLVLGSSAALGVSRAGAIGKAAPGHDADIIRPDGTLCDVGELGQIAVRRPDPVMFLGYWNQPEATEKKFIGDWMTTGDQGIRDADGYVHFVGRDDDVITSAGYRIGPGEIEDCLLTHPAVALAAAVGKPDALRTEIVKVFVVVKPGQTKGEALKDDIQAYVRTRLSAHEYPREIEFVDSLPMTTTGKVIRRELRARG